MAQTVELGTTGSERTYAIAGRVARSPVAGLTPPLRVIGQSARQDVVPNSEWVIADLEGGLGVRDAIIPDDEDRLWNSTGVQTHLQRGFKLPPAISTYTENAAVDGNNRIAWILNYQGAVLALGWSPINVTSKFTVSRLSGTEWQQTAETDFNVSNSDGAGDFANLGQPADFGGILNIPMGNSLDASSDATYFTFDGTTLTAVAFHSSAVKPMAFVSFRNLLVAAYIDTSDDLVISDITAGTPGTTKVTIPVATEGTPTRAHDPVFMVEGFASDGSRQLYVLVGGTLYLVDWDAAVVSVAYTSLDDVAGATAGRAAYVAMSQENPLQFYQGNIILNEGTGSVLQITPAFEVAQIGPIKDDGFDTVAHESILCIQTVRDFLLGSAQGRMYIFNGKGWHTLGDINGTPRRIFFDGSKVYYASGQAVSFDDIESLDTGNLERQVETGSLSYQQTADLETIRFDGGFAERPGTAYRLRIRANDITSTEKITVLFKSDTVSVYTAIIADNVFDEVQPTREFVLGPNGEGIAFKWIQLKFTLERDAGDDTLTPDMISATLEYEKLPKGLERFEFEVSETATMDGYGGTQRNIDSELFTLQDGETTQLLQHLVFAGKNTYVRVLGVSVVEALVNEGVGGGPAASQSTDGRYTVVCEERAK